MIFAASAAQAGTKVDSRLTIRDCRAVTGSLLPESGDNASLVSAACAGDRAAFGALYARYAKMIHGILLAKVPAHDVDDLLQDVFLRALPKLGDLRDVTRFGPWLATIARNRANDYYRQSGSAAALIDSFSEEDTEEPASAPSPGANAAMILALVRSLPEAYSETLILRLVEGMTGPEIAERTGLTPGSVRVNLHRGMKQLREKLRQASPVSTNQQPKRVGGDTSPLKKNTLNRGTNHE